MLFFAKSTFFRLEKKNARRWFLYFSSNKSKRKNALEVPLYVSSHHLAHFINHVHKLSAKSKMCKTVHFFKVDAMNLENRSVIFLLFLLQSWCAIKNRLVKKLFRHILPKFSNFFQIWWTKLSCIISVTLDIDAISFIGIRNFNFSGYQTGNNYETNTYMHAHRQNNIIKMHFCRLNLQKHILKKEFLG